MSKSMNMLRTRRRDNNVKPNRRLDRKSSRGMIYENEELRLKTININAEIERGQSDIKKLKRENEMLKKEIWCLRDEYEKLDKLLKEKDIDFSHSSSCSSALSGASASGSGSASGGTSDSESTSSYTGDSGEVEQSQNLENVQKTNMKNLQHRNVTDFDLLSVVPEETNSAENSEKASPGHDFIAAHNHQNHVNQDIIKADQSYPPTNYLAPALKHFFAPLRPLEKSAVDVLIKTDNAGFRHNNNDINHHQFHNRALNSNSSFSTGGNLEELLNDIENISQDILRLSETNVALGDENSAQSDDRAFKSELNVMLMPSPMPLIGFEKYKALQKSSENLGALQSLAPMRNALDDAAVAAITSRVPTPTPFVIVDEPATHAHGGYAIPTPYPPTTSTTIDESINPFVFIPATTAAPTQRKSNLVKHSSTDPSASSSTEQFNEEHLHFKTTPNHVSGADSDTAKLLQPPLTALSIPAPPPEKMSIRKKVSIHFKGKKDRKLADKAASATTPPILHQKTPSMDSKKSSDCGGSMKQLHLLDPATATATTTTLLRRPSDAMSRKSVSTSPERRHHHNNNKEAFSSAHDNAAHAHSSRKQMSATAAHNKQCSGAASKHRHRQMAPTSEQQQRQRLMRRSTISGDALMGGAHGRERSFSICTDRSNLMAGVDGGGGGGGGGSGRHHRLMSGAAGSGFSLWDDYSDRERTNSVSSVETVRKMSNISNIPVGGKIPWCACWGNGCL